MDNKYSNLVVLNLHDIIEQSNKDREKTLLLNKIYNVVQTASKDELKTIRRKLEEMGY